MDRERAEQILKDADVLLTGHFILTSGKHSGQYMQCARILQYPHYTKELIEGFIFEFKDDEIDVVVAPATGGIIIAYEMARQLGVKSMFAERENGKMTFRRGFKVEPGQRVLVAEDVITTGGTVREVIDLVSGAGGVVCGVAILVDRSMGKVDFGFKTRSAYKAEAAAYDPNHCPFCKEGRVPAVKPGSRGLSK